MTEKNTKKSETITIKRKTLKMLVQTIIKFRVELHTEILGSRTVDFQKLCFKIGLMSENTRLVIHNIIVHVEPALKDFIEGCSKDLADQHMSVVKEHIEDKKGMEEMLRASLPSINGPDYLG